MHDLDGHMSINHAFLSDEQAREAARQIEHASQSSMERIALERPTMTLAFVSTRQTKLDAKRTKRDKKRRERLNDKPLGTVPRQTQVVPQGYGRMPYDSAGNVPKEFYEPTLAMIRKVYAKHDLVVGNMTMIWNNEPVRGNLQPILVDFDVQ